MARDRRTLALRAWVMLAVLLHSWTAGAVVLSGGLLQVSFSFFAAGGSGQTLTGGTHSLIHTVGPIAATAMEGGTLRLIPGVIGTQQAAALTLDGAHAFPVPFKPSLGHDRITFRGMTTAATVRVYTIAGELVKELVKHDPTTNDLVWRPVTNTSGQPVASGVYLYTIDGNTGKTTGKLMIIR